MAAGMTAGRALLSTQHYEVLGHLASGHTVVTRMRWTGVIAIDAGPWRAGTELHAWCTAHYELAGGRISRIEQFDCYAPPIAPAT